MADTSNGHLTTDQVVDAGEKIYRECLRDRLEPTHNGECVVIEIQSGDYEVDAQELAALDRARARHPKGRFYLGRVGFPTLYRIGGGKLDPAR
jgi:hypothetical protein